MLSEVTAGEYTVTTLGELGRETGSTAGGGHDGESTASLQP